MKNILYLLSFFFLISCSKVDEIDKATDNLAIEDVILNDKKSFYYIDFASYPQQDKTLPIGVFDSGTGGLTVLNSIIELDRYSNQNYSSGEDGLPDFAREKFIYLADQANMPYGNYSSENKTGLLVEHILKDAQFLLSNKYYKEDGEAEYRTDKQKVKAIVIACNTATAYGKEYIEEFIRKTGIKLKVLGVIDAGARGALQVFEKGENGSIGVFATVGTIASKGYDNTIKNLKNEMGYTGDIQIYNQGGHGLAEAVDEEPDFINRDIIKPRNDYRGPSWTHADFRIDKTLMDVYDFDFDHYKMLCDSKETDDCQVMQINSADNYVRYHLVTLMEKMRKESNARPLKAIVLGCTHYPYLTKEIRGFLGDLYNYQKNGEYVYRHLLNKDIVIIDPSINVAIELYEFLKEKKLLNPSGSIDSSEFYISIPNSTNKNIQTESSGRFTYNYKYGRREGEIQEYVRVVPFSKKNVPEETINRLRESIPATFRLIKNFQTTYPETAVLNNQ